MNCSRCGGLMVPNCFLDYWEDNGELGYNGFRCVSCGEVIDPKILDNREALEPVMAHEVETVLLRYEA